MRSSQQSYDRNVIGSLAPKFDRVESLFISNDLEGAIRAAESIKGDRHAEAAGVIAASVIRVVEASPNRDRARSQQLYSRAAGNAHSVLETYTGSSEPSELILASRAGLAEGFAMIGLAQIDSSSGADPAKPLALADDASSSLSRDLPSFIGLRGMVTIARALQVFRVEGDQDQAIKQLQAVPQNIVGLPIYGQIRHDAFIEVSQGPKYFANTQAGTKGVRNLQFLRAFLPTSDLYLLDWRDSQPSGRVS